MPKKLLLILGILLLLTATIFGWLKFRDIFFSEKVVNSGLNQSHQDQTDSVENQSQQEIVSFDKSKYATDQSGSIWWVVNKTRPLPNGYVPADLAVPDVRLRLGSTQEQMKFSRTATPDLIKMFNAAKADGIILVFGSGYRSESLQRQFITAM
jgi:LAS superfamily LD-carboxypeptidase LdcB